MQEKLFYEAGKMRCCSLWSKAKAVVGKNIESLTESIFGCILSAMMEEGSSDGLRGRSIFDPLT